MRSFKIDLHLFVVALAFAGLWSSCQAIGCIANIGGSVTDIGEVNSFNFDNDIASYPECAAGEDCKAIITYQKSDAAFQSFPTTSLECVLDLTVDPVCKKCETVSTTYSLNSTDWSKVCKILSDDGLTTTYCSQSSNIPRITTSCYQGSFYAETPLLPSKCAPSTLAPGLNNQWCITQWSRSQSGEVSAIGACMDDKDQLPVFGPTSASSVLQACSSDNCNNVLVCYVGNWFQHQSDDSHNSLKQSLCYANQNAACQMDVSWSLLNGYTLVGSCQPQGNCVHKEPKICNDETASGTLCCTNQYCNDPYQFTFFTTSSSSSFMLNSNNSRLLMLSLVTMCVILFSIIL